MVRIPPGDDDRLYHAGHAAFGGSEGRRRLRRLVGSLIGESLVGARTPPALPDGASGGAGSASPDASLSPYVPPDEELYQSQGIYLLNVDSGEPVYNRNEMERIQPASLTKIMTALVVLESDHDLDNETTELKTYIQNYLYNLQAGDGGIYQGVQFTLRDLLYGSLTQSVNAAAMMLADYVGNGRIEDFCV